MPLFGIKLNEAESTPSLPTTVGNGDTSFSLIRRGNMTIISDNPNTILTSGEKERALSRIERSILFKSNTLQSNAGYQTEANYCRIDFKRQAKDIINNLNNTNELTTGQVSTAESSIDIKLRYYKNIIRSIDLFTGAD